MIKYIYWQVKYSRVTTQSCLLMQSQAHITTHFLMNTIIMCFPPINITSSFSLQLRWQNGSRFIFIIHVQGVNSHFLVTWILASFIIQSCLIQQATSGELIPCFPHELQGQAVAKAKGFYVNQEQCLFDVQRASYFPKNFNWEWQPVDHKACGS